MDIVNLSNMQKLFSIVFAMLMLFQSFNISIDDFTKLSVLLDHIAYHQEVYGDSFFDFIAEHYGALDHDDDSIDIDHDEHDDLPFKHYSQSLNNTFFVLSDTDFTIENLVLINVSLNAFYSDSYSLIEKKSVFQPPKVS